MSHETLRTAARKCLLVAASGSAAHERRGLRAQGAWVVALLMVALSGGPTACNFDESAPKPECGNLDCEPGETPSACPSDCGCGNGVINVGEQCDGSELGGATCAELGYAGGTLSCTTGCRLATADCTRPSRCGDGQLDTAADEVCDDGNNISGDGCSADCRSDESCGNGLLDPAAGEACDDGNTAPGDGCSATCQLESCGNLILEPGEVCDDGNTLGGDGCSADCLSLESCGNGILDVDAGEGCDDGNTDPGDGCGATCQWEYCGNQTLDPGEVCDDGNTLGGDGCSSDCLSLESCGNGVVDAAAGEACDDGNTVDGDGCQANCTLPSCGDGVVDANEACDDGNTTSGDGCNASCTSNETCGNGVVDGHRGEECDDTNTDAGDGCGPTCKVERCGNNLVDPGEVCDDGNTISGDDCNATCTSNETCGNGIADVAAGESCDGADLLGLTCLSLGFSSGTLACDSNSCALDTSQCAQCSDGNYFADTGYCYKAVAQAVTWQEARTACIAWGGELASIHSAAESDFINVLLPVNKWIGLRTGWTAWSDGTPLDYLNYQTSQPDGTVGLCIQMLVGFSGQWNDIECFVQPAGNGFRTDAYVCKR